MLPWSRPETTSNWMETLLSIIRYNIESISKDRRIKCHLESQKGLASKVPDLKGVPHKYKVAKPERYSPGVLRQVPYTFGQECEML